MAALTRQTVKVAAALLVRSSPRWGRERRLPWADERAQALAYLLSERGLTMSLAASRVLVVDHVEQVCRQTGVSERTARGYVNDDALADLADSIAFSLVEEFPGADLHTLARTIDLPVRLAGLATTALAEALLL